MRTRCARSASMRRPLPCCRASPPATRDREVLGAYGKALADAGRLKEASTVLANAHTPERPNWSILSAQGSVADQLGDHKQAQNYYEAAIRMPRDEPSVMSNLGLILRAEQAIAAGRRDAARR